MKKTLIFVLVMLVNQVCQAEFRDGVECKNCSTSQYKNKAKGKFRYNQSGIVYVYDFGHGNLKKFRVIHEIISNKSVQNKLKYLIKLGLSEKRARIVYLDSLKASSNKSFTILAAIEQQPTNAELDSFDEVDGLITQAESGFGDFDVDAPGSAYGYIGCPSCETTLGLWLTNNHTFSVFWREALAQFTETIDINAINFSFEYSVTINFADGSTLTISMKNNQYRVESDSYFDSDNNQIPRRQGDLGGTTYNFGDGNGSNINNFLDRARSFGIPISSGTGGGSRSCSFSCDSSGDCTITCIIH